MPPAVVKVRRVTGLSQWAAGAYRYATVAGPAARPVGGGCRRGAHGSGAHPARLYM
ncbi:hypothetical protein ACFPK5_38195 [Streptomyces beijiangensis]|uniref:hypothetical protein n=1 Tax=Streptomyces beijiangensis TaxID=163361 RepID=UPI003614D489